MKRSEKAILISISVALAIMLGAFITQISGVHKLPVAYAIDFGAPTGKPGVNVSFLPENGFTALTANTAGLTGTAQDMGFTTSKLTALIAWGGTTMTSSSCQILGSIDNSSFVALATHSSTTSPDMFHIADKPVRYIKGYFVSKVGGDSTSTVTMKVWAGGN